MLPLLPVRPSSSPRLAQPANPPTTHAVLKKKSRNGAAVEEAFDEFEEDVIEEDDPADNLPPSRPSDNLTKPERRARDWAIASRSITAVLSQSQFALRSYLPSPRLLASLIRVAEPARLDASIDMLARWRRKDLPVPHGLLHVLIDRLIIAHEPVRALEMLKDRTTYGLEIEDVREADWLFLELAKETKGSEGETEKQALLDAPYALRALVALSCPADAEDPVGLISSLCVSVLGGEKHSKRVAEVEKALKAIGEDKLSAFIAERISRQRKALRRQLRLITQKSEGEKGLVEMLGRIAERITLPVHMTTPFVSRTEQAKQVEEEEQEEQTEEQRKQAAKE